MVISSLVGLLALLRLAALVAPDAMTWLAAAETDAPQARASSAACLLALAAAVAAHARSPVDGRGRWVFIWCAVATVIALLTALYLPPNVELRFEPFNGWLRAAAAGPWRMHPPAAASVILLALSLVALQWPASHSRRRASAPLAYAGVALPYIASLAQLYDTTEAEPALAALTSISLTTSTGLLLIGAATLGLQAGRAGYRPTGPSSVAGQFFRAVLPAALVFPAMMGWVRVSGESAGWYHSEIGVVWMASLATVSLVVAALVGTRLIVRFERALWASHAEMEQRVRQRTAELTNAVARSRESENRFRVLAEAAPAMIWLTDDAGHLVYFNQAWLRFTGQSMDPRLGAAWLDVVDPDQRSRVAEAMRAAFSVRRPFRLEYRLRRRDGEYRWVSDQGVPRFEGDRFVGYVGTCMDIHDAKSSALALKASQQQLSAVLDAATAAIITIDDHCRIVLFNAAAERIFGRPAQEMLGQRLPPLLAERERHEVERELHAAFVDGAARLGPVAAELHGLRVNGDEFPLEMTLSRVEAAGHRWLTVVLRDLTAAHALDAERRARLAAEEASEAKSRFLSHLSHELRTPLNAVLGFSQLLQLDTTAGSNAHRYAQLIQEAGQHQLEMITDLLDLGLIEANRLNVNVEPVDVRAAVRKSLQMVARQAADAQIDLHSHDAGEPDKLLVMADMGRLRQVLVNLLTNAIKYNRPQGRVDLTLGTSEHEVAIQVSDTGVGMNDQQVRQLFTPFNRLGREGGTIEGTGIGLSLSRHLVELVGGRIEVDSVPDVGSSFTVVLRRAGLEAPSPAADKASASAAP